MRNTLILLLSILLTGCATTVPLKPVSYDSDSNIKSDRTAIVKLHTGIVRGSGGSSVMMVGPSLFVPISTGPYPHLQFNEEDQLIFIESLKNELDRLGILNISKSNQDKPNAEVVISVLFAQTHHNPDHQEYTLDVAMQIDDGQRTFANKYRVISSEGDSIWSKMNTNASEGKSKAAKKLMKKLIPDIESWVKNNSNTPNHQLKIDAKKARTF